MTAEAAPSGLLPVALPSGPVPSQKRPRRRALLAGRVRDWVRARIDGGRQAEAQDVLSLHVSESGWSATLWPGDGSPPATTAEATLPDEAPAAAIDVLRRAVRSISAAQRERIDSVRLLMDDRDVSVVDNRFLRLRSTDPVAIRQAGAQELGSKGAVYGFQSFGASSEHEMERGVYAFVSAERMQDYLGAMDSLAVKLVAVVPAWLPRLAAAGPTPFAAVELRADGCTLLLADPDSGAVACREFRVGTRNLAEALAAATSVSLRDAVEGMQRRRCIRPQAGLALPLTTTEHALAPLLVTLRAELLASVEYFVFQRLASAPERLLLSGEVARVRGLAEWFGNVLEIELAPAGEPPSALSSAGVANLLENTPQQLLRIGRSNYEFVDGRFRADRPQSTRNTPRRSTPQAPLKPARSLRALVVQPVSLATLGELLGGFARAPGRTALPVAVGAGVTALLAWGSLSFATGTATAVATLSGQLDVDMALRREMLHHDLPTPIQPRPAPLPWTGKLLALTRLVPDGMQLTGITVLADPVQPSHDGRLVIEGRLPARGDAVARVTDLVDGLSADTGFMHGASAITLDGANVAHSQSGDVVEFTLSAPLPPPGAPAPHG